MSTNSQFFADLFTFNKKILNGKHAYISKLNMFFYFRATSQSSSTAQGGFRIWEWSNFTPSSSLNMRKKSPIRLKLFLLKNNLVLKSRGKFIIVETKDRF